MVTNNGEIKIEDCVSDWYLISTQSSPEVAQAISDMTSDASEGSVEKINTAENENKKKIRIMCPVMNTGIDADRVKKIREPWQVQSI